MPIKPTLMLPNLQADEAGNINNVLEFDDADAFPRDKARFLEEI